MSRRRNQQPPDWLTHEEIVSLSGKRKFKAQARALAQMGVRFILRPDGSPVVARVMLAKRLGIKESAPAPERRGEIVVDLTPKPRRQRKP